MSQRGVLVEAESFADKGGWALDQQFMDVMGSPYLLAHGLGKPVADATTSVAFPAPGTYRLWVRTKNWVPGPWDPPGRFKVAVDGREAGAVFGTEPGWAWQRGGAVKIEGREATVALKDLTGFDGRCDALFFSADPAAAPPEEPEALARWRDELSGRPPRPESAGAFDVVVVGGGIAGCAAALAAERRGMRVALVHDRMILGGNASREVRVHTEGVSGRGADILDGLDTVHWPNGSAEAAKDDEKRHRTMDAASGVRRFLGRRVTAVGTAGGRIVHVDARHVETGEVLRFPAPVFVDCTGDGWVGYRAGAEFRTGRESRDEFGEGWEEHGELWSPREPDAVTLGTSVLWSSEETSGPAPFPEVPWAMDVAGDHAAVKGEWYWEYAGRNTIEDAEEIRDHMLRAIYGSFANAKRRPEHAGRALSWVAHTAGVRESRRLMGDYVYSMADMVEGRKPADAVVEETRNIDVHHQRHLKGGGVDFLAVAMFRKVDRYYVPFRCLYSRNVPNLLMAGRCFSCSHVGLGGPRVMRTCGQMGIAAGSAAALCVRHGVDPRGVYERHLPELLAFTGWASPSPAGGPGR